MNIYVGNLSYGVNESDLKEIFGEYGEVTSVKVIKDKFNGKSKGYAFVEMKNAEEGKKAIKELDGGTLENRKVIVNEAKPRN